MNAPMKMRPRNFDGYAMIQTEDGWITGLVYRLLDHSYLRTEAGMWIENDGDQTPITDARTVQLLTGLHAAEMEIIEEWKRHAAAMSQGDPILSEILLMNIAYTNGSLDEPVIHEGVPFWVVGHNASHEFSAGVQGGIRYRRSFCGGEYIPCKCGPTDCNCQPQFEPDEEYMHALAPDEPWGYIGHY